MVVFAAKAAGHTQKPTVCFSSGSVENNTVSPLANHEPAYMYYINDGLYGSFNCLFFDHAHVAPTLLVSLFSFATCGLRLKTALGNAATLSTPAMSDRNALLAQKCCYYLNEGRIGWLTVEGRTLTGLICSRRTKIELKTAMDNYFWHL